MEKKILILDCFLSTTELKEHVYIEHIKRQPAPQLCDIHEAIKKIAPERGPIPDKYKPSHGHK